MPPDQIISLNLTLKNVQVFENGKISAPRDIYLKDGEFSQQEAEEAIEMNCQGKIMLPGLIDPHVHTRDFEQDYKEDFESCSAAAAAGGYVYFMDMPNCMPPVGDLKMLEKRKKAAAKSCLPSGFHFGAMATDNSAILGDALKDPRVHSVKLYMNHTTGDLLVEDEKLLNKIFAAADFVSVHAEEEKVEQALKLAAKYETKLYLCHISLAEELKLIKKYKGKYPNQFFVEVTPHHLFLSEEDIDEMEADFQKKPALGLLGVLASYFMMRPPLKTRKDQQALWQGINSGLVDTIGTDHAPHTIEEKQSDNPPFGVAGLETALPLLLDAYHNKMISIEKIVQLMSENPARIFNLKNLGKIPSSPANFVLIDLEREKKVKNEDLKTKCGWSPFVGRKLKGWPVLTVADGKMVFKDLN